MGVGTALAVGQTPVRCSVRPSQIGGQGWVHGVHGVEVVRRLESLQGFAVQRWGAERTFTWLMRYRRLVRDYE